MFACQIERAVKHHGQTLFRNCEPVVLTNFHPRPYACL